MPERSGDLFSALRAIGGVLLALGAVVVFARRSSHDRWSDFELLLTVALPALALFALAVVGRSGVGSGPADPARAVLMVSAVLLSPVVLFQLLHWIGASTSHLLYDAAVLAATAAIAIAGARRAGAPYAIFLAGLALLGVWILLWLKIVHDPSAGEVRWIVLSGGVVLGLAAGAMNLAGAAGSADLATAGAVGAVIAGLQGVFVGLFGLSFGLLGAIGSGGNESTTTFTTRGAHGAETHQVTSGVVHVSGGQTVGWNIYLLVLSVALVWCGARSRLRGPAYVGFVGLSLFLYSVATQLTRLESGRSTTGSLLGWPLILVLLGIAGLAAPLLQRRAR